MIGSMRWTLLLLITGLAAACSSGGTGSGVDADNASAPPAPETSQVLFMLTDDDLDPAEIAEELADIREDFGALAVEQVGSTPFFVMLLPEGVTPEALAAELDDDARLLNWEPNYLAESPEGGPEDLPVLGSDVLARIPAQHALAGLSLDSAHAVSTGSGVVVAVVDTGFDLGHPALAGSIAPGGFDFVDFDDQPADVRDGLDNDGDGAVDEQYGHGTFVASLVLAAAPGATVMPVRVLDAEGFGTASTVAAGITWAADAGARVINLSVTVAAESSLVDGAIDYAENRGVVVVAATGNRGSSDVAFPARTSGVIAVTASDAAGVVPAFANTGSHVALVAPGVDLLGAFPTDLAPAGTARWSGTSFAAPLVSGAAALVRAAFPALEADAVADRLLDNAQPIDGVNPGLAGELGAGLVRPADALN
jgi:subtilisin family serine protease